MRLPPRLTLVTWSKVGVTFGSCALDERTHQNGLPPPARKRLPLVSTSIAPVSGELGILIGVIQVAPLSVERLNSPTSQARSRAKTGRRIRDPSRGRSYR